MSILEDKIRKNHEHYDVHEPDEGHFGRFESKLDAAFHQKKENRFSSYLKYAAGIIIIASISGYLLLQFGGNSSSANPMNEELAQVTEHFNRLTNQKLKEINTCTQSDEEAEKLDQMAREQLKILEADAGSLQEELNNGNSSNKVYGALINNYRTRIKILDNILYQICNL
jgi:hypothetical protein